MPPWLPGVIGAAVLALQAATFSYVVSIEHRLTRLETTEELRNGTKKTQQQTPTTERQERPLQEAQVRR